MDESSPYESPDPDAKTPDTYKDKYIRCRFWLLMGVVAVIAALVFFAGGYLLPSAGYAVTHELRVRVLVADADTQQPLSDVPVVVFWSPELHYKDTKWLEYGIDPLTTDKRKQFVTGKTGSVEFTWPFEAIVGKNAFRTFGSFRSNTWIQVAPVGYGTVVLPLDGQSANRRDYYDDSPLVVTVLLSKPKGK